ncbi:hypothetical protein BV25DRAFT_1763778, partial [Artomyces pyxidatus]
VQFVPPLHEQRRAWVLDILRREAITSVLDIGCGEGQLLQCLCHPAPWLRHDPNNKVDPIPDKFEFTHIYSLHGLDISACDLAEAEEVTRPRSSNESWTKQTRWDDLEVKLWEGGLETPNVEFTGIECIVAMEVIEHLPQAVVDSFAPVLLGLYQPRLLLITTPSYTFNELFHPPGSTVLWGYPDPTHRTARTFRHHDHQFEWTQAECEEWCAAVAAEWGFDVLVGGVGRAVEEDPWGRNKDRMCASQVACFRLKEGDDWRRKRKARFEEWAREYQAEQGHKHKLRVTHSSKAHESAGKPAPHEGIVERVKCVMLEWGEAEAVISELWREEAVSTLCGGWLEMLIAAIEKSETFSLRKDGGNPEDWKVELVGAL